MSINIFFYLSYSLIFIPLIHGHKTKTIYIFLNGYNASHYQLITVLKSLRNSLIDLKIFSVELKTKNKERGRVVSFTHSMLRSPLCQTLCGLIAFGVTEYGFLISLWRKVNNTKLVPTTALVLANTICLILLP